MNKNTKKLILGVTGIRSEYDIMSSVYKSIQEHKLLDLKLVVCGAHLSKTFGLTINEIKKDKFKIAARINNLKISKDPSSRLKGLAIQLDKLIYHVRRINPDFLLVLGDREEAMNTALVGAYMNIPVAHICGGDRVVGNVDDQVRHAVSKLAHLHFVTNIESEKRLIKSGEQKFRVKNVGNPGLDRLLQEPTISDNVLSKKLNIKINKFEKFILVIQHTISTEIDCSYDQMKITLQTLEKFEEKKIIVFPNSDPGSKEIIKAINQYKKEPNFYLIKNIPRTEFVNLLRRASCLVGNSSAGIMEAPLIKLPVINVGNRQKGRLHSSNVQFVPHNKKLIDKAIRKAIYDKKYIKEVKKCFNPYGDGLSSKRIANILSKTKLDKKLFIKDLTY